MKSIHQTIKQIIKERNYQYVMLRGFGMGLGEFDSLFSDRDGDVIEVFHSGSVTLIDTDIGVFKLF